MSITQCISLVLIEINLEGLLLDASYSPTTDPKTLPHIMKQTTKQTNHNISLKKKSGSLGVVVVVDRVVVGGVVVFVVRVVVVVVIGKNKHT